MQADTLLQIADVDVLEVPFGTLDDVEINVPEGLILLLNVSREVSRVLEESPENDN